MTQLDRIEQMLNQLLAGKPTATTGPSPARQHQIEQQAKADLAALRLKKAMKPAKEKRS
jgi:hypothetical protein